MSCYVNKTYFKHACYEGPSLCGYETGASGSSLVAQNKGAHRLPVFLDSLEILMARSWDDQARRLPPKADNPELTEQCFIYYVKVRGVGLERCSESPVTAVVLDRERTIGTIGYTSAMLTYLST